VKQNTQTKASLRLARDNQAAKKDLVKPKTLLSKVNLINSLNRINFSNKEIQLRFKHNKYQSFITLPAKPQVCNDNNLRCLWSDSQQNISQLKFYTFESFSYTDGLNQIKVPAQFLDYNEKDVCLGLPESSFETYHREIKRYSCYNISAQISQDGWFANGTLNNFTTQSLVVKFHHHSSSLQNNFDSNNHIHLVLNKSDEFIFSGSCVIIRKEETLDNTTLILKPLQNSVHRIKSKENRSERMVLTPLPTIKFTHPIIQKKFSLGLNDISGLGFSVEEDQKNSVLLPGMVIPNLQIQFMHGFSIQCKSQVLYRKVNDNIVQCGFVILDINANDHLKLSSLVHQAKNKHSLISSTSIDLDALWEFFFETGFVYPDKYVHISEQKEKFKELYKNLYNESSDISRHVIYQDKGKIYGHVSMFRYYQNTWLMQHHAAVRTTKHRAGLVVMDHILQYINESHSIPSAKMNYIACYFRKNNRFAYRVFGGAAKNLDDQQKCSLDNFAYFHYERPENKNDFENPWAITKTNQDDLQILEYFYTQQSGGLLIDGLDLTTNAETIDEATNLEYENAGFKRSRKLYSLKKNDELVAIFIVNIADLGMNLSELTNCIQVLVIDPKQVLKKHIINALSHLSAHYDHHEIPVLLYPDSYADDQKITYDKTYILTVLDLNYISPYLQFMKSLTTPRLKKNKKLVTLSQGS